MIVVTPLSFSEVAYKNSREENFKHWIIIIMTKMFPNSKGGTEDE